MDKDNRKKCICLVGWVCRVLVSRTRCCIELSILEFICMFFVFTTFSPQILSPICVRDTWNIVHYTLCLPLYLFIPHPSRSYSILNLTICLWRIEELNDLFVNPIFIEILIPLLSLVNYVSLKEKTNSYRNNGAYPWKQTQLTQTSGLCQKTTTRPNPNPNYIRNKPAKTKRKQSKECFFYLINVSLLLSVFFILREQKASTQIRLNF